MVFDTVKTQKIKFIKGEVGTKRQENRVYKLMEIVVLLY